MTEIIQDIKLREIASAYVNAHFDEAKQALKEQGYRIISLEENAKLRIQEGKDSYVSRNVNWTREGVVYIPKKGIFLTKKSPIMENPEEAANNHRNGQDFYLTDKQVEKSLSDSVELTEDSIPTNRFSDNEIYVYAFGSEKNAKDYGEFLEDAGIKKMPVWLVDMQNKPFVRQVWFKGLDSGSVLSGCFRGLSYSNGVRGVFNNA